MSRPTIYAADFDGTLCENKYPDIGPPNIKLIKFLKSERKIGAKVILWTMREGVLLESALRFCKNFGLEFDAVNDNIQEMKDYYHNNPRKVFANYYIDDHNAICDIGIPMTRYQDFVPNESAIPKKLGRGRRIKKRGVAK